MTEREAIRTLKTRKEVQALDDRAYTILLSAGLALLTSGVYPIARILPPPPEAPSKMLRRTGQ